jgi:hypothetical protein
MHAVVCSFQLRLRLETLLVVAPRPSTRNLGARKAAQERAIGDTKMVPGVDASMQVGGVTLVNKVV